MWRNTKRICIYGLMQCELQVKLEPLFREEYLRPFGLSEDEIRDTVTHEDAKDIKDFGGYTLIIFLKKLPKGYYLIVDGRWREPELLVSSAFKIFPHTLENVEKTPLIVLQHFARIFGYDLLIGDQYNKFVYNVTVEVPKITSHEDYGRVVSSIIKPTEQGSMVKEKALTDYHGRVRDGDGHDFLDIALAYCINNSRYIKYLHENDPGSVNSPATTD